MQYLLDYLTRSYKNHGRGTPLIFYQSQL
jgi:hypothetical protein